MKAISLFFWHVFVSSFPIYAFRRFYFSNVLLNACAVSVAIHRHIKLFCVGGVSVGENTTINRDVTLDGRGGIDIGRSVSISEGVKILTAGHDVQASDFRQITNPVRICDWVWIGANSLILPGVILHEGSVVGAGSVVTKDVQPYEIVAGNPAAHIGQRTCKLNYSPLWMPKLL